MEGNLRFKIGKGSLYIYSWKEFYVSNLQKGVTETRLEDADLCKMQPCKYFVYMDQGNPSQVQSKLCKQQLTATISDCNHLAHIIVPWQIENLCVTVHFLL